MKFIPNYNKIEIRLKIEMVLFTYLITKHFIEIPNPIATNLILTNENIVENE